MSLLNLKFFIILLVTICTLTSYEIFGQIKESNLKIWTSNTKPKLNEIVTITAEYKAKENMTPANILFGIDKDGVELIGGDTLTKINIQKGDVFKKTFKLKFTKKNVYRISIIFYKYTFKSGDSKESIYFVDGAFEEDARVRQMRIAIDALKYRINSPDITNFIPDTSLLGINENNMLVPIYPKTDSTREGQENKRKNDSLLIELRQEYDSLLKRLNLKRNQGIKSLKQQ